MYLVCLSAPPLLSYEELALKEKKKQEGVISFCFFLQSRLEANTAFA